MKVEPGQLRRWKYLDSVSFMVLSVSDPDPPQLPALVYYLEGGEVGHDSLEWMMKYSEVIGEIER